MIKRFIKQAIAKLQDRPKKEFSELSNTMLAVIGSVSFLIAGYWSMAIADVLPDMVSVTNKHGLTLVGGAIYLFVGGLGASVWYFGCQAKRCSELLYKRHFS